MKNLFLVQSVFLAPEHEYVITLTGHEIHCIESYMDCDFSQGILTVHQHWRFHFENKL